MDEPDNTQADTPASDTICPHCLGTGSREGEDCITCNGTGVAPQEDVGGG